MRRFLIAAALCASGAAHAVLVYGASEVFDTATGLDWSYLTRVGVQSLDSIENRTDGQRLATAAEVRTFFSHTGLASSSGTYTFPIAGFPPEFLALEGLAMWGAGVQTSFPSGSFENFITAPDSGQVGYVGTGRVSSRNIGGANYSYIDEADGTPTLYPPFDFFPFGAALVRAVPEPGTYLLMLLGLVGLATWRRLKKPVGGPL